MGPRKEEPPAGVQVGRYLGVGLTWAVSTLVFMLLGAWLGERLGGRSLGALIGAFVGGGAGFYWLVRTLTLEGPGAAGPGRGEGPDDGERSG
jgi:hypothetical protein